MVNGGIVLDTELICIRLWKYGKRLMEHNHNSCNKLPTASAVIIKENHTN